MNYKGKPCVVIKMHFHPQYKAIIDWPNDKPPLPVVTQVKIEALDGSWTDYCRPDELEM